VYNSSMPKHAQRAIIIRTPGHYRKQGGAGDTIMKSETLLEGIGECIHRVVRARIDEEGPQAEEQDIKWKSYTKLGMEAFRL